MKKLIIFIVTIILFISFLIFHDKGNEIVKPYLASYLENKMDNNISIKLEHLKIDMNYLEVTALVNELSTLNALGNFSLLNKTLDFNYTLTSQGFENKEIVFNEKIDINGTAKGAFDNINVMGKGTTLQSNIDYAFNLQNDLLNNIKVDIKKADIESLLKLTAQPNYAKGTIDLNINIPKLDTNSSNGRALIKLYSTQLNEKVLNKKFNLDLPPKVLLTGDIDAKVSSELLTLKGDVQSNLASLNLTNTKYNLKNKSVDSNYKLSIPELSKLRFITKQQLNGKITLDGTIVAQDKAYHLTANSKSLGGSVKLDLTEKKLDTLLKEVEIDKLLHLLNQKRYATGKVSGDIKLDDYKNPNGSFSLQTKQAKTLHSILKKELEIDLGQSLPFALQSKGKINKRVIYMKNQLSSELLKYTSNDMQYALKPKQLKSTYTLNLPKLSKLKYLIKRPLQGSLNVTGDLHYKNSLYLTGKTESLGGEVNFELINQKLTSNLTNVPVEKLMYLLTYPKVFQAKLLGKLNYDISTKRGKLTSTLNQARLLKNNLTELIKQVRGIDLTKERYNESHFNANINQDIIDIDFQAKSNKVLLEIPSGKINKASNRIDASYTININKRDLSGKIYGHTSKPQITVESSQFIQDEVKDIIKQNIDDKKLKDLGIGEQETEVIKNILGDLFK